MFVPSALSGASPPRGPSAGPPAGAVPVVRGPRSWRLPRWDRLSNPERLTVISRYARESAADPRIKRCAVRIFRAAGVPERDYRGQAAALLRAVQEGVYFVNEQDEVLQDPAYTLDLTESGDIGPDAAGDCDDHAGALEALCRSVHLPVRLVTSGRRGARPARGQVDRRPVVRYVQGSGRSPPGVEWGHIYNQVGNHPFRPTGWAYADATVPRAPLGWDVVGARGADPQRDFGDSDTITGVSIGTAATLVGVSVLSHVVIRHLERMGVI